MTREGFIDEFACDGGNCGGRSGRGSQSAAHAAGHGAGTSLAALALCALGVVFGDIGTSPLYTLKECLHAAGGEKTSVEDLYGILSLMFWAS